MNSTARFADTGYWLALINSDDEYYVRARALAARLHGPLVTTEAVILEVGDALSRLRWRDLGAALLADLRRDPRLEIIPVTSELVERAIQLYASRLDKEWGLTDCVSFVVMQERGIVEALAADQHFLQAGFRALLREDAP